MGMMINRRRVCGGKKDLPYGAVDMGLPSGTLWAQGNIVKDAQGNYAIGEPSDYGCYFSWGNIDGHNAVDGYNFSLNNYNASAGASLTSDILSDDALHDAAVARIGDGWHMPTNLNFDELFDTRYTTWQWSLINNVNGCLLTSIANGNILFFSCNGGGINSNPISTGVFGNNWSSSIYNYNFKSARQMNLNYRDNKVTASYENPRYYGFSIRPVYTPNN